jgi:hypothetical protein
MPFIRAITLLVWTEICSTTLASSEYWRVFRISFRSFCWFIATTLCSEDLHEKTANHGTTAFFPASNQASMMRNWTDWSPSCISTALLLCPLCGMQSSSLSQFTYTIPALAAALFTASIPFFIPCGEA